MHVLAILPKVVQSEAEEPQEALVLQFRILSLLFFVPNRLTITRITVYFFILFGCGACFVISYELRMPRTKFLEYFEVDWDRESCIMQDLQ
jgi:hypothetical protein